MPLGCGLADRPPVDDTPTAAASGTSAHDGGTDAAAVDAATGATVTLATFSLRPQGIALVGTEAVVTVADEGASGVGSLLRIARASPSTPETVADAQSFPFAVAASAAALAWTDRGTTQDDASLMLLASGAAAPRAVSIGETLLAGVALDDTYVYWSSSQLGGGILLERATLAGGAPEPIASLASEVDPAGVTVSGGYVYFVGSGAAAAVFRVPTSGGPPDTLLSSPDARFVDIVAVGDNLFVTDAAGSIVTLPLVGGASRVVASAQASPSHLAYDATRVYWTNEAASGTVMAAPIAGGAPVILASSLDYPRALAVDDAIYVTTRTAVLRIPK